MAATAASQGPANSMPRPHTEPTRMASQKALAHSGAATESAADIQGSIVRWYSGGNGVIRGPGAGCARCA